MILLLIFLSLWLGISFRYCWYIYIIVISVLLLVIFLKHTKKLGLVCSLVFGIGVGLSFIQFSAPNEGSYTGIVYEVKDNYYLFNTGGERLYVYEKDNIREIGDILRVVGSKEKLSFSTLESSFDFKDFLNKKGVFNELNVKKVEVRFSSFLKLHQLKKNFLSHFDEDTSSLVSSILFSEGGSGDIVDSVRGLHLAKFLSANGTYIYLILTIISYFLEKVYSKKWSDLSSFGISLIYLIFVFPRFTVIRICVLYILRWINKYLLNKKFHYFEVLSFSGIMLLLMDHYLARQDSFIIGYLVPIVFYLARQTVKRRGKVRKFIVPLVAMYIFFIPFELRFYNSICPLSPIFQILFTPLFIVIGLSSLLCFLKLPIYKVVSLFSSLLSGATSIVSKINLEIYGSPLNPVLTFVYYALFILLLYYYEILFIPIIKAISYVYSSFMFCYLFPIQNFIIKEVNFINVGQGDSCLIIDGKTSVLIDTGGLTYKDVAKDCLIPFFKKKKVYDIDLVITTHDDYDHSGAYTSLSKNFKVKKYITDFENFPIKIGNLTFTNYNNHIDESDEENAKSLVVGFNLGKKDYLIMGDAPIEIEKRIMEEYSSIPCDILKVGHHGSDTSSSLNFLKYLSPEEAIISCGLNNKFGHPHDSVIKNLKKLGIKIKRTDYSGTISYKTYVFNE